MAGHDEHGFGHVMPLKGLFGVFFGLIFLTFVTVAVARFETGRWDIVIALFIACIKAGMVAMWFMHLLHDKLLNVIAFFSSVIFLLIFIGFASLDSGQYQEDLDENSKISVTAK